MTSPSDPSPPGGAATSGDASGRPRRRSVLIAGSITAVAAAAAGTGAALLRGRDVDREPARVAQALADTWTAGDWDTSLLQDGPADVRAEYSRLLGGLASPPPRVSVASVDAAAASEGQATAELIVSFDLAAGHGAAPDSVFSYRTTASLRRGDSDDAEWRVVWAPMLIHPRLAEGAVITLERTQPSRAEVLGRDSSPIVTETDIVDVGVQPSRTTDPAATAAELGRLLGVDAAGLRQRIEKASSEAFVPVITLRRGDYDVQQNELRPVPGVVFRSGTRPLALTRAFARALLGSVGEVTAEIVASAGGRYATGDLAGLSGLQADYDERLAGRVGVVVRAVGGSTARSEELFVSAPVPGQPVRTTLDPGVQTAADDALSQVPSPSALVAIDTATGGVLAVANGPADGGDRALTGRFPPGSTFKVVTTLALLTGGFDAGSVVPCAPTYTVDGRTFRNYEGEAFGDVPFRTDFAQSCNTAFASLSPRLGDDALRSAGAQLGIGAEWATGVDAFAGDVPVSESAVDRAAASFGQGRTLVSPLAMAVAAASIAAGVQRLPLIVSDPAPPARATAPAVATETTTLVGPELSTLAELMRAVVTEGTAAVLAGAPGAAVHAKTGTAEYGTGEALPTHAWLIGWQATTAFAVFVTDGRSGGTVAAPIALDFLQRTAAIR